MSNLSKSLLVLCAAATACTSTRPTTVEFGRDLAQDPPPRNDPRTPTPAPTPTSTPTSQSPQQPAPVNRDRSRELDRERNRDLDRDRDDRRSYTDRRDVPWEVMLSGTGGNDEDFNVGGGSLDARVGYYFTEVLELSGRQSVAYSDDETPGGGDTWNFVTRVAFDVHIPLGVVSPFVGVFGGWLYGDSSVDDTFIAGPEVGAKIYLQRDAFLFAGAEWQFYFDEQDTLDAAFEDGQFFYSAGFGLRF